MMDKIKRKFARWWIKGCGIAYTTSKEVFESSEFWRNVKAAERIKLINEK